MSGGARPSRLFVALTMHVFSTAFDTCERTLGSARSSERGSATY